MCCFSRPVDSVTNTKIFARSGGSAGQFVVYSMQMSAGEDLAMILPIPVKQGAGDDAVRFISLEKYEHFFRDIDRGFPRPPTSRSKSEPAALSLPKPDLAVIDVGSFEASFVPTVKDFSRLDERFRLPAGTWKHLPAYTDYGFAVFKLKKGKQKIHPMAFQFPSAIEDSLFFPTVHIHDGKVHTTATFDHALYCQIGDSVAADLRGWQESPRLADSFVDITKSAGIVAGSEHCYKRVLKGKFRNIDVLV